MATIALLLWIVCGAFSAVLAKSKGRSPIAWLVIGCLLGILGPIVVALLPAVERSSAEPPPPVELGQRSDREPTPLRSRQEIERENLDEFAVLVLVAVVALVVIATLIMTDAPSAFNELALPGQRR